MLSNKSPQRSFRPSNCSVSTQILVEIFLDCFSHWGKTQHCEYLVTMLSDSPAQAGNHLHIPRGELPSSGCLRGVAQHHGSSCAGAVQGFWQAVVHPFVAVKVHAGVPLAANPAILVQGGEQQLHLLVLGRSPIAHQQVVDGVSALHQQGRIANGMGTFCPMPISISSRQCLLHREENFPGKHRGLFPRAGTMPWMPLGEGSAAGGTPPFQPMSSAALWRMAFLSCRL